MGIPITICIPLYNGIELLEETLKSIQSQTYTNWICRIGVNGHGPTGGEVFQKAQTILHSLSDARFLLVNLPDAKGTGPTKTELSKMAQSEWVAHCDADDIWLPQKLEVQVKVLEQAGGQIDVLGTWCQYFRDGQIVGQPSLPAEWIFSPIFASMNPMIQSSIVIRKELSVYTDEWLDDYDCYARLSVEGKKFYNIPHPFILHRLHEKSFFNTSKKQDPQAIQNEVFEKVPGEDAVTVVTAFYPMSSKFPVNRYLSWAKLFLEQTPCCLVVYTEAEYAPKFAEMRRHFSPSRTRIMILDRKDWMANHKWGTDMWEKQHAIDPEANHHSPDLYKIWYEKKEFVLRTIRDNPFGHEKFMWCDIGAVRHPFLLSGMNLFPLASRIPDDKMLFVQISPFTHEELTQKQPSRILHDRIVGGLQAGSVSAWVQWSADVDAMMRKYLDLGWFVGKDQTVYMSTILSQKEKYQILVAPEAMNPVFKWFAMLWYLGCTSEQWQSICDGRPWCQVPHHY